VGQRRGIANRKERPLKIAILGTGALGGYYGARLARAGETVHFIARGTMLEALRGRGLTVVHDDETFTLSKISVTGDAREVGRVALVLVTTKTYDLEGAAPALRALEGQNTIVIPLQNGVDIAERLVALAGPGHVLGGLSYLPASVPEPGVVRQDGIEKPLLLGPLRDADGEAADLALAVLRGSGIAAERPRDIRVEIWTKYVGALATMGVQSVTGQGFGTSRSDPDIRPMYLAVMREAEALARRSAIALPDGTPERLMGVIDGYPGDAKASMLQDLERGKPLELEAMHGTAVRLGERLGVPTPVIRSIYTALEPRAGGRPTSDRSGRGRAAP
jgi:2-dehydropantoate 2-reductase